ncbi:MULTISPECIES: hypothetical protein [unclassified Mesorhizobium]|uniref:hypothetical protein n=1 Tax=unclassified Mesorhizobium TaxID=325217 RepID=UPI0003CE4EAE|nr:MULTISPECIES: hypothetical protein [unclassified Mesorhizobium]ESX44912.1 hypothetical protein X764_01975 [Mesorhizobium sp. LSHC440A00]ESX79961.1 hypothetical protein X757_02325 [Mesorhizobium sp. LSHC414A00]WJI59607.1 hypothetical protein NLY33_13230 [Mesorhizobium sp. C432A]
MGRIVRSAEPVPKRDSTLEGIPGDAPLGVDDDKQEDQGSKGGDGYLDRVAKYVPAEVVAFFIFVNSILVNATEQPVAKALTDAVAEETKGNPGDIPGKVQAAIYKIEMAGISVWTISWIMLIVALAMTPVYLKSVSDSADDAEAPGANIVMSMLAFPFWAYAVNALALRPWHDGALASIMLATFTLISGAIRPEYISAGLNLIPGIGPKK